METNHYNKKKGFGEQLVALLDEEAVDDEKFCVADEEEGKTLKMTVEEESFPGGKYFVVSRMDLLARDYVYPDDICDKAPCLDDCLIEPDYDDLWKMLNGEAGGDDDEPTAKKNGEGVANPAEEMGIEKGGYVLYKGKKYEVLKVAGVGTSLTLESANGKVVNSVSPEDVVLADEEEDSDDKEPAGQASRKLPPGRKKDEGGDDEDLDEDDSEDEDLDEDDSEDEDLDDEDDEDAFEDEDDEAEEKPRGKKPPNKPSRR